MLIRGSFQGGLTDVAKSEACCRQETFLDFAFLWVSQLIEAGVLAYQGEVKDGDGQTPLNFSCRHLFISRHVNGIGGGLLDTTK